MLLLFFKDKDLQKSITFTVLQLVFGYYLLIAGLVTIVHLIAEYNSTVNNIHLKLRVFEKTFSPPIAEAFFHFDEDLLKTTVEGILRNPEIVGVSLKSTEYTDWSVNAGVYRKDNTNLYGSDMNTNKFVYLNSKLIEHAFSIKSKLEINGQKKIIAYAKLYSSHGIVRDEVKLSFVFIVINAIIKTVALWFLFLNGARKYITMPLQNFSKQLDEIKLNNLKKVKVAHTKSSNNDENELHKLENSFNYMVDNLSKALQEINQTRKYLNDVLTSMPAALIGINEKKIVCHWNSAAENLFQLASHNVIGMTLEDALPFLSHISDKIDTALEKHTTIVIDKLKQTIGNKSYYLNIVIYTLTQSGTGVIIKIENINKQVQMESKLIQSEKLSSLGTLACGMTHELNNPLGSILQSAQNIMRRLDADITANVSAATELNVSIQAMHAYMEKRGIWNFLEGIRVTGERAAKIVKNLLAFSKHSTGSYQYSNFYDLITNTIEILGTDLEVKHLLKKYNNLITLDLEKNIPDFYCVPQDLKQAILNILKNAIYAVSEEAQKPSIPKIIVKSYKINDVIRIEIEDNGPGIDEKIASKIFDPFFTTKPTGKGMGLGLYLCSSIIAEKHQGKIWYEPVKNGNGTIFILELPIITPAA